MKYWASVLLSRLKPAVIFLFWVTLSGDLALLCWFWLGCSWVSITVAGCEYSLRNPAIQILHWCTSCWLLQVFFLCVFWQRIIRFLWGFAVAAARNVENQSQARGFFKYINNTKWFCVLTFFRSQHGIADRLTHLCTSSFKHVRRNSPKKTCGPWCGERTWTCSQPSRTLVG